MSRLAFTRLNAAGEPLDDQTRCWRSALGKHRGPHATRGAPSITLGRDDIALRLYPSLNIVDVQGWQQKELIDAVTLPHTLLREALLAVGCAPHVPQVNIVLHDCGATVDDPVKRSWCRLTLTVEAGSASLHLVAHQGQPTGISLTYTMRMARKDAMLIASEPESLAMVWALEGGPRPPVWSPQ